MPGIAKTILKKTDEPGVLPLFDRKTYYKATIIKTEYVLKIDKLMKHNGELQNGLWFITKVP